MRSEERSRLFSRSRPATKPRHPAPTPPDRTPHGSQCMHHDTGVYPTGQQQYTSSTPAVHQPHNSSTTTAHNCSNHSTRSKHTIKAHDHSTPMSHGGHRIASAPAASTAAHRACLRRTCKRESGIRGDIRLQAWHHSEPQQAAPSQSTSPIACAWWCRSRVTREKD